MDLRGDGPAGDTGTVCLQLVDRKQQIKQEEEPSSVTDQCLDINTVQTGRPYKTVHDPVLISEVLLPPAGMRSRTSLSLSH